jgi:hypothetical protein
MTSKTLGDFMKKLVLLLLLLTGFSANAFINNYPEEGEIPFPVGSEVPFPWDVFEGEWSTKLPDGHLYRFRILDISQSGVRRVWVEKMPGDGTRVLARGSATMRREQRVLHARIQGEDSIRHQIRLAAYNDVNESGCANREIVMSITDIDKKGQKIQEKAYFMEKKHSLRD